MPDPIRKGLDFMKLLMKWMICFGALALAVYAFPARASAAGLPSLFAASVILWLLNIFLRPLAQLIALPVTILTFGLFGLAVNAFVVWLAGALLPGLALDGFLICVFIALVISAGNLLFIRPARRRP